MTARSTVTTAGSASPSGPAPTVWQSLGGYRLLRTIGAGSRSVVYLAAEPAGEVAVKAMDASVDDEAFGGEAGCLASVASPHVVRLLDVSVVPDRPRCLLLERLPGPSLATLLRERATIEVGEAVTLAVSVIRGVHAVHAAGWAHGALSLAKVRLDASGRPVLLGFGDAVRSTAAGVQSDWIGAADAVDSVFDRIDLADPQRLARCREAVRSIASAVADEVSAVGTAQRELFALSPAAPISMKHNSAVVSGEHRTDLRPVTAGREPGAREKQVLDSGRSAGRLALATLSLMENGVTATVTTRLQRFARARRRPLMLAIGAAAVITLGALLLLPPGGSASHAATNAVPAAESESPAATPTRTTEPTKTTDSAEDDAANDDADETDPVKAAARLLALRSEYLSMADAEMLADIEQAGSPILAADTALVSAGRHSIPAPSASQLSLAETLGDAAVIAVAPGTGDKTKPASALLIRTDAGWRLRALFEN
ncbi:MAG TPA: protein kinase [Humibacter sp.]|nr:protein kinase [Humibacter sp.]